MVVVVAKFTVTKQYINSFYKYKKRGSFIVIKSLCFCDALPTGWPENGFEGYEDITRYVIWKGEGIPCHGFFVRDVCIFGVGDLPRMSTSRTLFVNKFYYDYQPMALTCMEERHYNWTRQDILGQGRGRINITFYENLPNVKNHILSGLEHHAAP